MPGIACIVTASVLDFGVRDRTGSDDDPGRLHRHGARPVREGREVIVTVEKQGGRYVGERNSLITKCPSKYKTAPAGEKQN